MFEPILTYAHVTTGTIALIAGASALIARKGARLHVTSGKLFAASMGASSLMGAVLGLLDPTNFYITFHAGVLGTTLILSSWLAAQAHNGQLGHVTSVVSALNLLNAIGLVALAILAINAKDGRYLGFAASSYFFLFAMAAIALIGDASLLLRKSLTRPHRIARHLWRMCLAFFIAAGSAFTGPGAEIFPDAIKASGLLVLPELLILLSLIFWLGHTYWIGRRKS